MMSVNRRGSTRSRLLQRGKIVFNGGFTAVDCVVLDVSEHGARLQATTWMHLPQRFELRLPNCPPRKVEIRHRAPDGIGVRYLDGASNP